MVPAGGHNQKERRLEAFGQFVGESPSPVDVTQPLVDIVKRVGRPALLKPRVDDVDLVEWCRANRGVITTLLDRYGAVRFRGFEPQERASFRRLFSIVSPEHMQYQDRSSPRREIEEALYTSTDHPPDQVIRMHCELSYSHEWPPVIAFYCESPALEGGETPLADTRMVLSALSEQTRRAFEKRGVRYYRNLLPGVGLHWSEVFGTDSRADVEDQCAARGIEHQWLAGDGLQIQWTRPAIRRHPRTGEAVWFNHASFFHSSTLDAAVVAALGHADPLPFSTTFGDGSPIPPSMIQEIQEAYERVWVVERWEKGDIVVLDNLLTAHGRRPFRGHREIFVMMGAPRSVPTA